MIGTSERLVFLTAHQPFARQSWPDPKGAHCHPGETINHFTGTVTVPQARYMDLVQPSLGLSSNLVNALAMLGISDIFEQTCY